ncbi:MAG TPA: TrbI/VirB10 family protein [Candidatus Methylacidiphilales bacterium]|nr:TrbI/VirB10 family protein [Candidatus Methylacidiphilales bacterium]
MIDPRKFVNFFKTTTGRFMAFACGISVACAILYTINHSGGTEPAQVARPSAKTSPQDGNNGVKTILFGGVSGEKFNTGASGKAPAGVTNAPPIAPPELPLTLYHGEDKEEPEVSDTYAPYGRLIPCETVITIDSARIETPIIGFVTEDVWHDGRLIIPAGAEVHGKAQVDPSRERIASADNWVLVWRTSDRMDGAELPLHGVALDMERNEESGTWALTDGSAGLRGDIIKTDNWAEIKLFAATFLSAATTGLEDTQTASNALTGQTTETPVDTPKNAALQGASAVLNQYAQQILDSIKRDGFYVRVPAGKQFYLYVTQTIDLDKARRGESLVDLKPETKIP